MKADRLEQIGVIGKPHGLEGVVRVLTDSPSAKSNLNSDNLLYLQNRRGDLIPVRIESVREEIKRGSRSFFVKFEKFASRTESEAYQDCLLYAETMKNPIEDNETAAEDPATIVGFDVQDRSGLEAVVTGLLENPAHLIIVMQSGEKSFMVPWVDEYVLSVDRDNHLITCRNLGQLIDL